MPLNIQDDDEVVSNDLHQQGAPAVLIIGNRVQFSNSALIMSTSDGVASISMEGVDTYFFNAAGGDIRSQRSSVPFGVAISGSVGTDTIVNEGFILGDVLLGDGDDAFVHRSDTRLDRLSLGEGNDTFRLEAQSDFRQFVSGGTGYDRYAITEEAGSVDNGSDGFERLDVANSGAVNLRGFSNFLEVHLAPGGGFYNFLGSENPLVDLGIDDLSVCITAGSGFRNVSGGDGFEEVLVGDTLDAGVGRVSGNIDLGDGTDRFVFEWRFAGPPPALEGAVDGGAGADILILIATSGRTIDVSRFSGFEQINSFYWTSTAVDMRLINANGYMEITAMAGKRLVLDDSNSPDALLILRGQSITTIGAQSVVYQISAIDDAASLDASVSIATADENERIAITNAGVVRGNAILSLGSDLLDGRLGTIGGNIFGLAGDDMIYAGSGDDRIDGGFGNDELRGGDGNDQLFGFAGNDGLFGEGGDDYIEGGDGGDYAEGGDGNDTLYGQLGADLLLGGLGNDGLFGGEDDDQLGGGDGNDYVEGGDGNDQLYGNAGADFLLGGLGNDGLLGGDDDDQLGGGAGADYLDGGAGNDNLYGDAGNDVMIGGLGNDGLLGGDGDDQVNGGDGGDYIEGGLGNDNLFGDAGNDVLFGEAGNDGLFGGDGDDQLGGGDGGDYVEGGLGNDNLYGNVGNDVLFGEAGNDGLFGGDGDDQIGGGDGGDYVEGGAGNDNLYGNAGNDLILGGLGNDGLFGGDGDDQLAGGDGGDYIEGGVGNDTLLGEGGADVLLGGDGSDAFVFTAMLEPANVDQLPDFVPGVDVIVLGGGAGQAFAALASGTLAAGALRFGRDTLDQDDRILYDGFRGALSYDPDGTGPAAAFEFAFVRPGTSLTAANFVVSGAPNTLPTITSGTTGTVTENNAIGAVVYQAVANDADGDIFSYRLSGADQQFFSVDANGIVRAASTFDYETRTSYQFSVEVYDSSGNGTSRQVTISVANLAEATPVVNETTNPNNAVASAQTINRFLLAPSDNPNLTNDDLSSVTIRGEITPSTDVDFYAISLLGGEQLILDIDNTSGNLDVVIRIYNSAGEQLGYVDDAAVDPGSGTDYTGRTFDSFLTFRAPSGGTYYFSVESYGPPETWDPGEDPPGQGETSGTYQLNVSIGPVGTAFELLREDIEALISGASWPDPNPNQPGYNLTYAFPDAASDYSSNPAEDLAGFAPFDAAQQAATAQLLQLVANVAALTFTNVTGSQDGTANLRYAENDQDGAAYAYYPGGSVGGTAWFNHQDFNTPTRGGYAWMGILHETGHALGLKHGHEFPPISFDRDSLEYTVMTYRSYPGGSIGGGYGNETWGYPQTLMMLDIAALQEIYGANYGFNAGNTVYAWSPTTGGMSVNGAGQGQPGGNRIFMTVWDGGGVDTYDYSNYASRLVIDLRPGEWSSTGGAQLANLGDGRMARGNVANALLFDDDPRSLIENAIGGSGSDMLIANQAANVLTGGAGTDMFSWRSREDLGAGALADLIGDFTRGEDKLDLSRIDALPNTLGDDAFTFLGTGAFTGAGGELRYVVIGGSTHLIADLDGDLATDMQLILSNVGTLAGSDFLSL